MDFGDVVTAAQERAAIEKERVAEEKPSYSPPTPSQLATVVVGGSSDDGAAVGGLEANKRTVVQHYASPESDEGKPAPDGDKTTRKASRLSWRHPGEFLNYENMNVEVPLTQGCDDLAKISDSKLPDTMEKKIEELEGLLAQEQAKVAEAEAQAEILQGQNMELGAKLQEADEHIASLQLAMETSIGKSGSEARAAMEQVQRQHNEHIEALRLAHDQTTALQEHDRSSNLLIIRVLIMMMQLQVQMEQLD